MRIMWGVALCIFLSALDQTIVVPAEPAMAGDLKGFGQLSWIVSVYLLTSTAATPILGKLSDSHGRRSLLLLSIADLHRRLRCCARWRIRCWRWRRPAPSRASAAPG